MSSMAQPKGRRRRGAALKQAPEESSRSVRNRLPPGRTAYRMTGKRRESSRERRRSSSLSIRRFFAARLSWIRMGSEGSLLLFVLLIIPVFCLVIFFLDFFLRGKAHFPVA